MYIVSGFWSGVLATLFVEMALFSVLTIRIMIIGFKESIGDGREDKN